MLRNRFIGPIHRGADAADSEDHILSSSYVENLARSWTIKVEEHKMKM